MGVTLTEEQAAAVMRTWDYNGGSVAPQRPTQQTRPPTPPAEEAPQSVTPPGVSGEGETGGVADAADTVVAAVMDLSKSSDVAALRALLDTHPEAVNASNKVRHSVPQSHPAPLSMAHASAGVCIIRLSAAHHKHWHRTRCNHSASPFLFVWELCQDGWTPLHFAAHCGGLNTAGSSRDIAALLLDRGAKVDAVTKV